MPNPSTLVTHPLVDPKTGMATVIAQKFLWALAPQKPVMLLQSLSASPFIFQSGDRFTGFTVAGGTVSDIEVSNDGVTFASVGVQSGFFQLQPYDQLRITFSVSPVCYACYRVSA